MKQSQFYYLLRRGLFSAGSAIIKNGLVMFNKFTTAGLNFPAQGSAEFDGASDYIDTGADLISTNHTFAAWVYANDDANTKIIFDNRSASGAQDGILVRMNSDENIVSTCGTNDFSTSDTFTEEWVYVVASYDGTTQKLYTNGSLNQSATTSQTLTSTANAIIGGRSFNTSLFWNGNLANVAIWNRALSSDEINSVMFKSINGLTPSELSGLQAWYSLDDISGSSVPDSSGNGNNGTAY